MKRVLSLILVTVMVVSIFAGLQISSSALASSGQCGDNVYWKYMYGTLTISGNGPMYDYYQDKPYDEQCLSAKRIIIEEGVTRIGDGAFAGWGDGIQDFNGYPEDVNTTITIPNSVVSIGRDAFSYSELLERIIVPISVTKIESSAFAYCTGLKRVDISSLEAWCKIIFDGAMSNPTYYAGNLYLDNKLTTNLAIPRSITKISDYAFINCSAITNITIPNSVTSIGKYVFSGCSGLTSITIPNSVTNIGDSAFSGCSGLTSISIPNSVTNIGGYAFSNCNALTSITVAQGNSKYDSRGNCNAIIETESNTLVKGCKRTLIPNSVLSIGDDAFSSCSDLTSITIPDSVTRIGNNAFSKCDSLKSVIIGNSVLSIGNGAFRKCSSLTSATIGNSVTSIGQTAFSDCSGLTSITIPNSVTNIGASAFFGCSGLTNITIPYSVKTISLCAFYGCGKLTSITIPDSVTSIEKKAFENCSSLTRATFGNSVTSIGEMAFSGCSGLTSITIPNSVTSIGDGAFSDCSKLTSITIPDSITSIGSGAFSDTAYYKNSNNWVNNVLYIGKHLIKSDEHLSGEYIIKPGTKTIQGDAFWSCRDLTSITIPDSVSNICRFAFYDCRKLTSITIPDSVTSIGASAFEGCSRLTSVTINNKYCEIYDHSYTIYSSATIYGYTGSTAQAYAEKYGRTFVALDAPSDTTKPIGSISSTNNVAASQTATLTLSDDKGVAGYYWGTNSNYSSNTYTTASAGSITKTVSNSGTYYLTVKDTSGNISDTVSVTYYKTTLNANSGSVSPASVLTKIGNSFTFPTPTRSGYTYQGWNTSSTATSGVKTLSPSSNTTYYAVWFENGTTSKSVLNTQIYLNQDSFIYDGNAKEPAVTVKDGDKTLIQNKDYVVVYSNNINIGIATVTIVGIGDYNSTKELEFNIICSHQMMPKVIAPTATKIGYTEYVCIICGERMKDATGSVIRYNYTSPTGKPAGFKCASRTAKAMKFTWTKTSGVSGYQIQLLNSAGKAVATKTTTGNTYSFAALTAAHAYKARVRFYIKAADGNNYYGAWSTITSPTLPKETKVSSLTAAKKAFTAKWGKVSGVTGYQLQYSVNAKFSKATTKTVKGAAKVKLAVKSLKGGTKYFVRVRTYKTVGGKNYYSTWSATKSVRTK